MGTQQPIAEGTSATVRTRSGACEIDAVLTVAAVPGVRDLVSACLRLWGLTELDWRVTLTASELLTNAFQHARQEGAPSVPVKESSSPAPLTASSSASVTPIPGFRPPSSLTTATKAVAAWC